jgi:hypothetical protein
MICFLLTEIDDHSSANTALKNLIDPRRLTYSITSPIYTRTSEARANDKATRLLRLATTIRLPTPRSPVLTRAGPCHETPYAGLTSISDNRLSSCQ